MRREGRCKRGLTLVEILVVMGIILLVLGLLVPTFTKIYRAAESLDFRLTSSAFARNQPIPAKYTAEGEDVSPPLTWTATALPTRSIVVILTDQGGKNGPAVCDWILFNLSPSLSGLPDGYSATVSSANVGRNDLGLVGYTGPAPPKGSVHQYDFYVYTLDRTLSLGPAPTNGMVQAAMKGHILQSGFLWGTYER